MRYFRLHSRTTAEGYLAGSRPPLDALPKPIADKLQEHDRILTQLAAARTHASDLAAPEQEATANAADTQSAANAARAGKPIPAATALETLTKDREAAARAIQAHVDALADVTNELEYLTSDTYFAGEKNRVEQQAKTRADVLKAATVLADKIEAAVEAGAVHNWMRHKVFDKTAQTWPVDVIDLARYALDRKNTTPVNIRDVIMAAAVATLDDDPTTK